MKYYTVFENVACHARVSDTTVKNVILARAKGLSIWGVAQSVKFPVAIVENILATWGSQTQLSTIKKRVTIG